MLLLRERLLKWCERCNAPKPPRAHHCRQCERCVMRMDHHCPWVSNCVGVANRKKFLLFVFYVWAMSMFYLAQFMWEGLACFVPQKECRLNQVNRWQAGALVAALCLALFFCLFAFVMLAEQLNLVRKNTSLIEQLQSTSRAQFTLARKLPAQPEYDFDARLTEIMGGECGFARWRWFLPLQFDHPSSSSSSCSVE